MDHTYAIENHTAERYLMHELGEEERDAYEEHFFSCNTCAEEVKFAAEFLESARQVVQDEVKTQIYGHAVRRSIWGSWLNFRSMLHPMPAMACALLILVSGVTLYQSRVTIPDLKQMASAQMITSEPIVLHSARAAVEAYAVPRGQAFTLQFDIPPTEFSSYSVTITDRSGIQRIAFADKPVPTSKNPVEIAVAAGILEPGRYVLLVEGTNGTNKGEIGKFTFELKFQD